jgi:hypothetical protein
VEPDAYNGRFGDLLPRPIRVAKTAAEPSDPDVERRAERWKELSFDHPIFAPFSGRAREGLLGARFYRYLLLEAAPGEDKRPQAAQVLATFQDGAPALLLSHHGKGRVLFFASTLDRDWTDLPIRTSYLPLVQRFTSFLGGALDEHPQLSPRVGQQVTLRAEAGQSIGSVRDPHGKEVPLRGAPDGAFEVGPLREPGLYSASDAAGMPLPQLGFGASVDPAASDLTRLHADELAARFGEESVRGLEGTSRAAVPIWSWLLLAAVVFFFFEGTLLRS